MQARINRPFSKAKQNINAETIMNLTTKMQLKYATKMIGNKREAWF